MHQNLQKDRVNMWRDYEMGNLEIVKATHTTHTFGCQTHKTFAIGFFEAGIAAIFARGTMHKAVPSDIIITHPDEVYDGHAMVPAGFNYRMLYLSPQLFRDLAPKSIKPLLPFIFFPQAIIKDHYLLSLLRTLHWHLEQSSNFLRREIALAQLLTYLLKTYATFPLQASLHDREYQDVALIKDYIQGHYNQSLPLEQLSSLVQLHPSYLVRKFHATMGVPPHVYLIHKRILQAKCLLLHDISIAQVALETGFTDQSHLTRHFTHVVGAPPARYLRHVKNVQDKVHQLQIH